MDTRESAQKGIERDAFLEQLFAKPADRYMPVPWWSWSGGLDPELMRQQLREMYDQGIREFFIFPISGLEVPFMSDEYIDRIRLTVEECKKLGMKFWIYDELNFPSGTAAGLVPRNHPYAVAAPLYLEIYPEASEADIRNLLADDAVFEVWCETKEYDRIVVLNRDNIPSGKTHVSLLRRKKDEAVNLTVSGCLWTKNEPGVTDLLSRKAVRAFIDEAYEPIAKAFPDELGTTIKGFFTDEPQFAHAKVPWTDGLEDMFKERFGYDIKPRLHELFTDAPGCDRLRIHFWSLVSDLCANSYTGQLAEWCGEHNMELTGHLVNEENSYSVWLHGDSPEHLLKMQIPGCDLLNLNNSFTEAGSWYWFGPASLIKTPKNPASAARFTGHSRVLCEAYGVVPWWKTSADEKWITDWLVALGVNLINDNSLPTDICGYRKRSASGKHFTQPYWADENLYYTYTGRICALTAETVLDTELLLLYPTTTWWADVHAGFLTPTPPALREREIAFDTTADALVRKHWHFEFLFEQMLEHANVEGGALVTGYGTFRAIVIAGISHLRPQHAKKLEEFAASGGAVFMVGSDIRVMEENGERLLNVPSAVDFPNWKSMAFGDEVDLALSKSIRRPWTIRGAVATNTVSAARFDKKGGKYLFIANMTPGDKDLEVTWESGSKVEMWDADSGARWTPEQQDGKLKFTLPQDQSVWLVQAANPVANSQMPAHFITKSDAAITLDSPWSFKTDRPNLYSLNFKLKPDKDGTMSAGSINVDDTWIADNAGDVGIALRPEDMKYYWVVAEFDAGQTFADLQLIVDTEHTELAYLNGDDLGASKPITIWDEHNRVWDIGAKAKPGKNILLMKVKSSPYYAENVATFPVTIAELVVLRGSFGVDASGKLVPPPTQLNVGGWGAQGLVHYAGVGIYEKDFKWPGGDALFDVDCGRSVVEVIVDGVSLGKRAWAYRRFIARNLPAGEHKIEVRITNTLAGILRRFYEESQVSDIPPCGLLSPLKVIAPDKSRIPAS